ncbi:MAG TPA: transposase [Mycobacteriales bacterium]|nr:transposase [Mycobacteriales bacterium]
MVASRRRRRRTRDNGEVAEVAGLLRTGPADDQLAGWPATCGCRPPGTAAPRRAAVPVRTARGLPFQVTATSIPTGRSRSWRHATASRPGSSRGSAAGRTPACVGCRPKFAINSVWCATVGLACDLLAWLALLALDGEPAKAEPKKIRYRLLHTAGRIVHGQRRRRLRIPETWP